MALQPAVRLYQSDLGTYDEPAMRDFALICGQPSQPVPVVDRIRQAGPGLNAIKIGVGPFAPRRNGVPGG